MRFAIYTLLALSCWSLLSCSQKTEERERVLGYTGLASRNPYLAAERYLEADSREVVSSNGALRFDPDEGLVISPASSVRSVGDSDRLLEWVSDGGHFVCFLERGEDYFKDVGEWANHTPGNWSDEDEINAGLDELLLSLDVEVTNVDSSDEAEEVDETEEDEAYRLSVAKGKVLPYAEVVNVVIEEGVTAFNMKLGGVKRIKPLSDYYVDDWYEAGEEHRFMSRSYGSGRVTFISDARAFRNPYLKLEQHTLMLDHMATNGGKVVFSLGKVPGFMGMLMEQAWMALYGLLLLTVLWIWKNVPRFGPLLDVSEGHSRNYAEQVANTGKFLWRNKCDDSLLQPLRDAVVRQSGQPFMKGLDTPALVSKLSESSGIAPELITEAMTRTSVRDANSMVRITKTLQSLLKSL